MWSWHPDHMGFGVGGWIGMAFMLIFWIAVIVGVVYLVRYLIHRPASDYSGRPPAPPATWEGREPGRPQSSALQILEERYARGEIDQAEFLSRRADLTGRS